MALDVDHIGDPGTGGVEHADGDAYHGLGARVGLDGRRDLLQNGIVILQVLKSGHFMEHGDDDTLLVASTVEITTRENVAFTREGQNTFSIQVDRSGREGVFICAEADGVLDVDSTDLINDADQRGEVTRT